MAAGLMSDAGKSPHAARTLVAISHGPGPRKWPRDPTMGRASGIKLGMWVFLLSDAFSFGGLLLAYAILRAGALSWWPAGEPAFGINFTAGLTFLLICSSLTMVLALHACRAGKRGQTTAFLALTILGGCLFLTGQYHEYFGIGGHGLIEEGLKFGQSHRATTFYLVTSFHGFHVFSGVLLLIVMLLKTARGKFDHGNADTLEAVGLFWHFVDLVWILVFTFIYLIPVPGAVALP